MPLLQFDNFQKFNQNQTQTSFLILHASTEYIQNRIKITYRNIIPIEAYT